jgi:hypothetical protein
VIDCNENVKLFCRKDKQLTVFEHVEALFPENSLKAQGKG